MMQKIDISDRLKATISMLQLYAISAKIRVQKSPQELITEISEREKYLAKNLKIEDISKLPPIYHSREAYKKLGKEPARYRLSAEALIRRMVKRKGIYQINNIVEITNIISLTHYFSIGTYDADKIQGDILFDIGRKEDIYESIGRGLLNIENLPVFRDKQGAFGNPTSDSNRTKISSDTQNMLMIIIDFGRQTDALKKAGDFAVDLLKKYAVAAELSTIIP